MASSAALMQVAASRGVAIGLNDSRASLATRGQAQAALALPRPAASIKQSKAFRAKSTRRHVSPTGVEGLSAIGARKLQKDAGVKSSFLGSASAFAVPSASERHVSPGAARGGALTAEANLFSRIYRIFVSTVTGAVKSQEDPSKLLDQAVIDMESDLGKVKQATAAVLGSQRQLEQKYNGASQVARMWYDRARLALSKGEEDLARKALEMRKIEEDKVRSYKEQLDKQTAISTKLVANTRLLESKIKEAQSKKDSLKYRAEAAKATQSIQEMLGQIDTSKAIYAFEKLEEDVLRAEAKADALSDMVTSDMDAKFAALESDSAVEDDLEELRRSMSASRALPAPKPSESESGKSVFWKEYVDPRVERELAELRGQISVQ